MLKPPSLSTLDKICEEIGSLRHDLYAIAAVALFATDHPVAGGICIALLLFFA